MRLRFDFWLFCFQSQLVKARNHGGVSSDLEVSVSETLAASMIVRSQQLCLFFSTRPATQDLSENPAFAPPAQRWKILEVRLF